MSKVKNHHFSGETPIEVQHSHEHDTLQLLQRLAGDGKRDEFFELLEKIENEDKRKKDRSNKAWYDIRTLKKIKLIAKDKLNATKQKLFA